jgi:hypothetical protein
MRTVLALLCASACTITEGGQSPAPDAGLGPGNVICIDDSPIEPNETIATAFPTAVGPRLSGQSLRAALCPASDQDLYRAEIPAGMQLDVAVIGESALLELLVLDPGGVPIGLGRAGTMPREVVTSVTATGPVFVSLAGNTATNYRLDLQLR